MTLIFCYLPYFFKNDKMVKWSLPWERFVLSLLSFLHDIGELLIRILQTKQIAPLEQWHLLKGKLHIVREDVKIPHSRMTKTGWETLVNCL